MSRSLADYQLVFRTGPLAGTRMDLPIGRMSIGRDATCTVKIDDPKVSRLHCYIEVEDTDVLFRDNNSTNGSLINGKKVRWERVVLGDVIQVGVSEIALLEREDFNTIMFNSDSQPDVTAALESNSVSVDALASKFSRMFEYYKANASGISLTEQKELARTQRLLDSLQQLFNVSSQMSRLLPVPELLEVIGQGVFDVFAGADTLVILLAESGHENQFVPRYAADRSGDKTPKVEISTTVLNRAVEARSTLVANDVGADSRFSASESIVGFHVTSVLCAPLVIGENVLGALYLDNRNEVVNYDDLDAEIVTAFANQAAVALDNARLCDNLQDSYHQMLQALVKAIEAKDQYTMGHTQRVKEYTLGIARQMGFDRKQLERLAMAAELHDIGKIGVKERIINKPGGLTDTEYESIKMHVEMGEMILKPITYLHDLIPWIRSHHEKWDGSGYPDGLKGEECPLEGRILAAADAFDAMTSQRSYNKPLTFEQAVDRVRDSSGKHFDPAVAEALEIYVRREVISRHKETIS